MQNVFLSGKDFRRNFARFFLQFYSCSYNNTVENIVENNAKLSAKILNNYQRVTEVGCYLGTDGVNWPYKASDAVNITDAYTNVWYDNAARDFGTVLQPGTTYYYKFYAVVNGTYSEGQVGSFTTTGIPRPPVGPEKEPVEIQNNSVADITETNAKLSAKVLNNYQKVTEVGCYLGKSQNHLNYKASDKVNITDVYTNVWYENIPTEFSVALEPGTTYYYQFYAVVNGQTYTGSVGSFTTKKAENKDPVVTFSNLTASNITQTNAILTAKVDNKSKSQIIEIGCYAGINKNNLTLKARQGKYSTESLSLEFSMNQDFGETTLIADTMYYYQFYVIADGQEIKSEKKAFRSRSLGDIEREKLTEVFLALVGVDDIGDVTSILLSADSGRTGFWGVLEKAVNVKDRLELIMTAAKQIDDLTNMVGNNWISKKNPWQSLIARAEQIELAGAKGMAKAYNLGLKDANTNNPVPEEGLRQHESTVVEICDDVIKRIDEETSQFYMRMFFRDTRNRLLAYKRTLLELKADYDLMEFYNLGRYGTEGVSQ